MSLQSLLGELKRRNLHRAAAAYVGAAWVIVQVADTFLPRLGFGDRAVLAVTIVLAIGFVPAMIAAWSFELTPEGLKREQEVPAGSALEARTNRLLDRLIMLLLALGLAFFAIDKFVLAPGREAALVSEAREEGRSSARLEAYGDKSIVVLPFENLSSDPEQEFLADGLAEELRALLSKSPELRVISRGSANAFKGKGLAIGEIARQLDVAHVLEGSVRRAGARLRIAAQLVDARTDAQLWSETYDRELADVFAIQDDIAGRVARELETRLLGRKAVARTTDPQAYLYFLEARHHLLTNGADEYPKVRRLLEAALAIDPDYLEAWVGVSRLNFLARGEFPDRPADWPSVAKARRLSQEALDKATALDPANPAVLGFRGMLSAHDGDFVKAASYAAHAMRLAPDDPDVLFWATSIALRMRRPEIAVQLGERAVARDPRCMGCLLHLLNGYAALGRAAEADVRVQRFRVVSGGRDFWYTLGLVHLNAGDLDGALASFEHAPDRQVDSALQWHGRALALYALGRPAEAREARANFEARRRTDPSEELWIERAGLDAWMGAPDSAVATLEPPFADAVFFHRAQIASLPVFRKLDGHPAWEALLERYGIGTAQLAAIPFEIELPSDPRAGASAAGPVKDPRAPAP